MISGPGRNGHTLACLFQAPLLRPSSSNPGGIDQARPGTRNVAVSSSETGPGDRGPGGDFGDPEPVLQRACSSQHSKPPEHALPVLAGACTSEGTGHRHDQAVWNAVNPGGPYPASVCTGRGRPYAVGGAAARNPQEPGLPVRPRRRGPGGGASSSHAGPSGPGSRGDGPSLAHGIAERAPALAARAPFLSAPLRLCSPEAWPPRPGAAAVDAAERSVLAAS